MCALCHLPVNPLEPQVVPPVDPLYRSTSIWNPYRAPLKEEYTLEIIDESLDVLTEVNDARAGFDWMGL